MASFDLSDDDHAAARDELKDIEELVKKGVLGAEMCPEPSFCRWPVLEPGQLPAWADKIYRMYDEIRWYSI